MTWSSRSSIAGLVAVLSTFIAVSGCTVLYLTTSDEENLLCGPEGGPRCQDGFACVRTDDGADRCVRAGFKAIGDVCVDNAECEGGGICVDAYASLCPADSTDINCTRIGDSDTGLRCRAPCDEAANFACDGGERCFFFEGVDPFCQKGTCATDSDCEGGVNLAFCVGEQNGGRSGFCSTACDPLECFDGVCPCAADQACAMPPDEFAVSTRNVCTEAGVLVAPQTCDVLNPCADGHSCVFRNDGTAVCVQWCRVGGGAPACSAGICQNVVAGSLLGICQ